MILTKNRAIFELLMIDLIWGFSFIAIKFGLEGFDSLFFNFLRFFIALVVSVVAVSLFKKLRVQLNWYDLKLSLVPGVLIGLFLTLQSYGLTTTSIANSSFITTLYVVMVPLIEALQIRRMISLSGAVSVAVAMFGTALLTGFTLYAPMNLGDFFTLLCAVAATFHILWLQDNSYKIQSVSIFNVGQFFWATIVAAVVMIAVGVDMRAPALTSLSPWLSLLFVAIAATLVTLVVEVRVQKVLSAFSVSLLYLLEAPLASLFAYLMFKEQHSTVQWIGALMIMGAAYIGMRGQESLAKSRMRALILEQEQEQLDQSA